ncbi:Putative Integral membrane protein TmpA [Penicillium brasilianum]|uniref:Putative Integral membrane protein TmpA n=1 Tax=Penicillium brasilianum TaxID=104259 RepID=A0A0F7U3M2_PENBI|nr:Putative Integral membrane protein TmpA [Penicillium brasilianum]
MSDLEKAPIAIPILKSAVTRIMNTVKSPNEMSLADGDNRDIFEEAYPKEMVFVGPDSHHTVDSEAQTVSADLKPFAFVRYAIFTLYRRLFTLVFCANAGVFIWVMLSNQRLLALVNATAANLLACGLARQPLVVNAIFRIVLSVPRSAPFALRRIVSEVYHYGGVHSGGGVAALVWYIGFIGVMSHQYWTSPSAAPYPGAGMVISFSAALVALAYVNLVLLLTIIVVATPKFRIKRHDYFELTHRFSGWLVVTLFVALLLVFAHENSQAQGQSMGLFLLELPAFWFLILSAVAIVQPWLMLRKVPVRAEILSTHAVRLHLDHAVTAFGKGIQLAKHPLLDWHGFATFPDPSPAGTRGTPSFSCLVSKAGDWTADTIKNPPTHLWKRGVLLYGFAYSMRVFKRVIVVTTGSGIGPCLSFLGDDNRPALRVLWQTRAPLETYGQGVMDLVRRMDDCPIIMDTDRLGRVDMVPIVLRQFSEFKAEAVCVISNPVLTRRIVYELETRGVAAFGPIFDS